MKLNLFGIAAACGLAIAPVAVAQEVLYAINDYISPSLLQIDPANGNVLDSHTVTGHESLFGGLTADENGVLFSIDGYNDGNSDRLFTIDAETGAGAVVGDTGFNWNFRAVAYDSSTRTLYGATDNNLFIFDPATGAGKLVAPITGATLDQLTTLAIDDKGNAYITDIGDVGLFTLNLATGEATHLGNLDPGQTNWFDDLDFDSAGTLWGGRLQGGLYTVDIAGLSTTFKYGGTFRGLAFSGATETCYADFNGDGLLDLFDFLAFVNAFNVTDPKADCDANGGLDLFDFLCFVNAFNAGC
jgi:hypothetical protein